MKEKIFETMLINSSHEFHEFLFLLIREIRGLYF